MPPKHKKPSAVTSKRHDTGLIPPGKSVNKQRSNPALSGNANGKPTPSNPSIQSSLRSSASTTPPESTHAEHADQVSDDMDRLSRNNGARGGSNAHLKQIGTADKRDGDAEHDIDYADGDNGSNDASTSVLTDTVKTVIGSHRRLDTFAMLLLLLQMPVSAQLIVQLTCVGLLVGNDTNTWLSRWLLLPENWLRLPGGNPSLGTSIISDLAAFGFWLLMPQMLQDLALGMALVVIAMIAGGGVGTRDSWKTAGLGALLVVADHLFRSKERRQLLLHRFQTIISKLRLGESVVTSNDFDFGAAFPDDPDDWFRALGNIFQIFPVWALTILRTMLGVHITTYGLIRAVRGWVETFNDQSGKTDSKGDLELASAPNGIAVLVSQDSTIEGARTVSGDGRPPGPSPAPRDKGVSTVRKRRKQAAFVRAQQPFWAAIANTKLLSFSKESELSQADKVGFESGRKGEDHFGGSSFDQLEQRAWMTDLEETEIGFSAVVDVAGLERDPNVSLPSGKERRGSLGSKYLDVRINSAFWSSVDCKDTPPDDENPERCVVEGQIYGLTPFSSYFLELVSSASHNVIYSATVSTRQSTSSGHTSSTPAQAQESLRPLSPTTTLRTSVSTVEGKIADHKAKSSKAHRTHQTANKGLKQEISELTKSLQSGSGSDERQRQRQLQYSQSLKQTHESQTEIESQLSNLGDNPPKADKHAHKSSKDKHDAAVKRNHGLKVAVDAAKRDSQKAISEARGDNNKLHAKREKAENRLTGLNDRRKAAVEDNNAKRDAKAFNEVQHKRRIDLQRNLERELVERLQSTVTQKDAVHTRVVALQQQLYYDSTHAQQLGNHPPANPHTPENNYNKMAPGLGRPPPGFGFQPAIGTSVGRSRQNSSARNRHDRSSSMLSNVSGLTDDMVPSHHDAQNIPRNGSASSGNQSSPHPKLSPIGTEVGRGSPRNNKK